MNQLPRVEDMDDYQRASAAQLGVQAVERELMGEHGDSVQIAVYVNGRMIHTRTDSATVARIMALLTGIEQ